MWDFIGPKNGADESQSVVGDAGFPKLWAERQRVFPSGTGVQPLQCVGLPSAMNQLASSLDMFLLVLVKPGIATAYGLREKAGLSIGGTLPALKRLEQRGLVSGGERLVRNKREFRLTARGRTALKAGLNQMLKQYQEQPPSDLESVLRVCSLAAAAGKRERAGNILRAAALTRRGHLSPLTRGARQLPRGQQLGDLYQHLLAGCDYARLAAEAGFLEKCAVEIFTTATHRRR